MENSTTIEVSENEREPSSAVSTNTTEANGEEEQDDELYDIIQNFLSQHHESIEPLNSVLAELRSVSTTEITEELHQEEVVGIKNLFINLARLNRTRAEVIDFTEILLREYIQLDIDFPPDNSEIEESSEHTQDSLEVENLQSTNIIARREDNQDGLNPSENLNVDNQSNESDEEISESRTKSSQEYFNEEPMTPLLSEDEGYNSSPPSIKKAHRGVKIQNSYKKYKFFREKMKTYNEELRYEEVFNDHHETAESNNSDGLIGDAIPIN